MRKIYKIKNKKYKLKNKKKLKKQVFLAKEIIRIMIRELVIKDKF